MTKKKTMKDALLERDELVGALRRQLDEEVNARVDAETELAMAKASLVELVQNLGETAKQAVYNEGRADAFLELLCLNLDEEEEVGPSPLQDEEGYMS